MTGHTTQTVKVTGTQKKWSWKWECKENFHWVFALVSHHEKLRIWLRVDLCCCAMRKLTCWQTNLCETMRWISRWNPQSIVSVARNGPVVVRVVQLQKVLKDKEKKAKNLISILSVGDICNCLCQLVKNLYLCWITSWN